MTTLTMTDVTKVFGPVTVVDRVSLTVEPGTVHVLLGENGAGKSTIIKMMSGVYQPDGGSLSIDGKPVTLPNPAAAQDRGIATIHQELNLVPQMSVAENICLGRVPSRAGIVSGSQMKERAERALDQVGLRVDVKRSVSELGVAQCQLIEIAKALSLDASVLILDEPTAALTGHEASQLFEIMDGLRDRGVAMVFISHHLDEIARVGDIVSVLRDGQLVDQVPASTEEDELVRLMVGRSIDEQFPRSRGHLGEPLLEVRGLGREGAFRDINLTVHAGEVVGLAGLVGAGRTEVVRAIAGADPYQEGEIRVHGKVLPGGSVGKVIRRSVGMVPEDRKSQGLVLRGSVEENLGLAALGLTSRWGLADRTGLKSRAATIAKDLKIRAAGLSQPVGDLSGGNQQKVVFGKWLMAGTDVLLMDEPTRGVDVGARVEIYQFINRVTERGGAVLMASSELPEVIGMSDRILVMSSGRIAGEIPAEQATQDAVMSLAVTRREKGDQ